MKENRGFCFMSEKELSGIVIVKKEEGITSQSVVNRIKKIYGVKKAGHTGTLDPMASGVLPVLIGRAVKASDFLLTKDKHYVATILLGTTTDSEDITGNVISKSENIPSEESVYEAVNSMLGVSLQTPPMYSAIKMGGRKLCDLAREGKTVDRNPREICIFKIKARKINELEYELYVHCSKGTYIRTLCKDIGEKLSCGACMKALCRTKASSYTLDDAKTIGEIEKMNDVQRESLVRKTEEIFVSFKKITLSPFFSRLARCGQPIYTKKIGASVEVGERVTFYDENGFFALGEASVLDGQNVIKPIRQFDV